MACFLFTSPYMLSSLAEGWYSTWQRQIFCILFLLFAHANTIIHYVRKHAMGSHAA